MTQRYLDPTNDVAFKKIFGDKAKMKDFLNAILHLPDGAKIAELSFIPTEEVPEVGQGKRSIFDLRCRDERGKTYIVEMENRQEAHFLERAQFYGSHTYVSQLSVGKLHTELLPVIVVAISKRKLFPKELSYISHHTTRDKQTNQQHLCALSYVFIELPKFKKKAEELRTIEDFWIFFLSKSEQMKEPPETIDDKFVLDAYKAIEQFNWSKEEYDAYLRARLLVEAEESTLEESHQEGIRKGIEKGKIEGEELKAREIAIEMLREGLEIGLISRITGLSEKEVKRLRDK